MTVWRWEVGVGGDVVSECGCGCLFHLSLFGGRLRVCCLLPAPPPLSLSVPLRRVGF